MPYATRADIEKLYSSDFVLDLLPSQDGFDQDAAVARALEDAGAEIDAHLSARYVVPIPGTPVALRRPAIDIAAYIMANAHGRLSETIEERYKSAVKLLERMADGKAGLGVDEPGVDTGGEGNVSDGAYFSANERLFGRGNY